MSRWLAILLLLCVPQAMQAQQVGVRSGEHEGFSRLVFSLPARIEWSLENGPDSARLRFPGSDLTFDTSTVFERIGRERLADLVIAPDRQSLTLRFACDCAAEAFWFRRSMLVIDVAPVPDGAPGQGSVPAKAGATPKLRLPQRTRSSAMQLVRAGLGYEPSAASDAAPAGPATPVQRDLAIFESRDRLLRQVGRATVQGLLDPRATLPSRIASDRSRKSDVAAAKEQAPGDTSAPDPPRPSSNMNINARTSIDRDFLNALSAQSSSILADGCLDAKRLDVASWGTDAPFWEQVGPLRSGMTSEFDRTDDKTVRRLAQLYLYFGFGLEARDIADILPPEDERTFIYKALASIMDGHSAERSILADQLECDAPAAMWAALSHPRLPRNARIDTDAVLRAFSALPRHLRTHLGPVLSARLLAAGHEKASVAILRNLDRVEETRTPAADMVAAELALGKGQGEAAEKKLERVVESNGVLSPDALARQIDSLAERGNAVPADLAELASAYAFEHAGTPLGTTMARAHVLALGATGAFDEAFAELDRYESGAGQAMPAIRAALTARLASHGAPIEILRHVLAGKTAAPDALPQDSALKLADHLLEAGFHDESRKMLAQTFHGGNIRRARMMRARAALELGRPRQAEVELLGLDGKDANTLRARARSMVGEHRQAYDLFKSAGLEAEAEREAWLAGDGTAVLAQDPSAPLETTVDLERSTAPVPENRVLARNRALLEDTGATRDSVQALLAEAPAPAPEN
ncbi:MAG: hypothetical protein ACE369_01545 [Roseovarius sp.]